MSDFLECLSFTYAKISHGKTKSLQQSTNRTKR